MSRVKIIGNVKNGQVAECDPWLESHLVEAWLRDGTSVTVALEVGTGDVWQQVATATITGAEWMDIGDAVADIDQRVRVRYLDGDGMIQCRARSSRPVTYTKSLTGRVRKYAEGEYIRPIIGGACWVLGDSTAVFASEGISGDISAADSQSPFVQLNAITGGILYMAGISASSGVDTGNVIGAQIPVMKSAIAAGTKVDFVFLSVTANDFYHSSYLRSAAYVQANVTRILRDLAAMHIPCVILNGLPRGPAARGSNTYSVEQQTQQLAFVAWANAAIPAMFPQHFLIDSYSIAANPDGTMAAGWLYDDLHQNTKYARAIAKTIDAAIDFDPVIYPRVLSASDVAGVASSKNAFAGSAIGGTIGATTLPAGWTAGTLTNCTATYEIRANEFGGAGNMIVATCVFSAAGQIVLQASETSAAGTRIASTDSFFSSSVVSADESATGVLKDVYNRAGVSDGTTTKYSFGNWHRTGDTSSGGYFEDVTDEVQIGAPKSAIAAVTTITFQQSVRSTGAGTVILRFAEPAVWKV